MMKILLVESNFSGNLKIKSKITKTMKKNEHKNKNNIKAIIGRKTNINIPNKLSKSNLQGAYKRL
jgi:hypothetical protein